jgi:hypothetical protein
MCLLSAGERSVADPDFPVPDFKVRPHHETSNYFPETVNQFRVANWAFLTSHAWVLLHLLP